MIAALGLSIGQSVGSSLVGAITGNTATDRARATREAWTLQMAQQGSPTAAAIIIAAPSNVSGNESGGWRGELSQIPAAVLAAAQSIYGPSGWWPKGQPDFYTDLAGPTHTKIVAEVASAALSSGPSTAPPLTLPSSSTSTTGLITGTGVGPISSAPSAPAPYIPPSPPPVSLRPMVTTAKAPGSMLTWAIAGVGIVIVLVVLLRRRHG